MATSKQPETTHDSKALIRATAHGTFWNYVTVYSGKILVLVSTIVLARLLSKGDFGIAGYAVLIINFLSVLTDLGIGPALIYHRDEAAADTAFWISLAVGTFLFGLSWLIAPFAANFFRNSQITAITRVLGLSFPILAFQNVHSTLLRKNLAFGRKFIPDLSQTLVKGILSIVLAALGFSYWSLIIGQLGGLLTSALVYWIVMPWRPSFHFSISVARALLSYGTHIVLLTILAYFIINIDYLFIGRYLDEVQLGVYTVAFRLPELVIMQFCAVIAQVVFPVYAKMRDDANALSRGFTATARYVALITIPCGLGLALVAQPLTLLLFGQKWNDAIPVMRAIALYAMFNSLAYNTGDIYKAQGRVGILNILNVIRLIMLVPVLWWAVVVQHSIVAAGWGHVAVSFMAALLNLATASRLLHIRMRAMLEIFQPAVLGGAVMALAVAATLLVLTSTAPIIQVIGALVSGVLVYVATLWWLQRDLVLSAGSTLRTAFARR